MSHLDEVIARVDAAIEESVIAHMNELLIDVYKRQSLCWGRPVPAKPPACA